MTTFWEIAAHVGWPFALIVFCLFVIVVISHFGFESRICLLIAPVPVHCFLITFVGLSCHTFTALYTGAQWLTMIIDVFLESL